jgi:uncharacterized protein YerC
MTKIKNPKQFKSRQEWEQFLWNETVGYLLRQNSHVDLKSKLEKLFSERERDFAIRRLTALLLLNEGKSYREIGNVLWISPATISQIKKIFSGPTGYHGRRQAKVEYSTLPKTKLSPNIEKDFISWLLSELKIIRLRSDPKKRWEFLHE